MSKDHLTEPDPQLAKWRRSTPQGMGHWAGTGPNGATCGGCKHYGYWYSNRNGNMSQRKSCCEIYFKHGGNHGDQLPASTPACKYFAKKPRERK